MRRSRLFVDAALRAGTTLDLPSATAHYLARVLRLTADSEIVLFDGHGVAHVATLQSVSPKSATARVGERLDCDVESPLRITLLQGLCRGQRMDLCVQKATELGVARIVPVQMQRSVVRVAGSKVNRKVEHWRAIAVSACEQSGRTYLPVVEQPVGLDEALEKHVDGPLAMLDASGSTFDDWHCEGDKLTIVIGPEGGYGDRERESLIAAGAQRWRMGPRILRTETAGMVAIALAQSKWGDMSQSGDRRP